MIGKRFRLKVFGSVLDWSHGFGKDVEELFIPELGIGISKGEIFSTSSKRYEKAEELGEVEIRDDDVAVIQEFLRKKEEAMGIAKKYL